MHSNTLAEKISGHKGFLLVLAAFIFFSLLYAGYRVFDGDEGFYMLAAKSSPHKMPYTGYFFTQTPLAVPYYSFFSSLPLDLFFSMRLGSIIASCLAIFFVYLSGLGAFGKQKAVWASFLLGLNFFFIQWAVVVKTYALSMLAIAAFLYCIEKFSRCGSRKFIFAASFIVALGFGVRLYLAVLLVPLLFAAFWVHKSGTAKLSGTLAAAGAGLALGFIPSLFFMLPSLDRFFFDTVQWHTLYAKVPLSGMLAEKAAAVLENFIATGSKLPVVYLGNIILVALALRAWLFGAVKPGPERPGLEKPGSGNHFAFLCALCAASLAFVIILAPLAFSQYYVVLLPALCLLACLAVPQQRRMRLALFALFIIPTVLLVAKPVFFGSDGIVPSDIGKIRATLEPESPAGGRIFTTEALFALAGGMAPVESTEMGRFTFTNSMDFTQEKADRYLLMNRGKITAALSDTNTTVFVSKDGFIADPAVYGFSQKAQIGGYRIFTRAR